MTNKGPQQLRQEAARALKLEAIEEQVAGGTLSIRQMTAAEKKKFARPAGAPTKARRSNTAHQRGRG